MLMHGRESRVSASRLQQAREQLGLPSAFDMVEATQVLDLYTSFGVAPGLTF